MLVLLFSNHVSVKAQTAQAYATLKTEEGSLTFYYGDKPAESDGLKVYDVDPENFTPTYLAKASDIKTVTFDASFNSVKLKSCCRMFANFSKLTTINNIKNLNTKDVTNMSGMFMGCSALEDIEVSSFNTANVDDMSAMFARCTSLKTLDLSYFNTAKLKITGNMFGGCLALETIYVSDLFVTNNIETSIEMFDANPKLVGAIAYGDKKANDATLANYVDGYFKSKTPLQAYARLSSTTISFPNQRVLTFYYGSEPPIVDEGEAFYSIDPDNFTEAWSSVAAEIKTVRFNKSFAQVRLKSCASMFKGMGNLKNVYDIENLNTENVTAMNEMFADCERLDNIDVSTFNTTNVENMSGMFGGCLVLKKLDLVNFKTPALAYTIGMFDGCKNLETIYAGDDFVIDNIKEDVGMFSDNDKLVGAAKYSEHKTQGKSYANYKTGYFSYYYTIGGEKHPIAGDPLKTDCLDLVDGKDFETSKMFDAENATYSRNVSHKWSTLCLPYAFDAKDNATAYFYEIKNLTDDVLYVTRIDGTVEAGVPVIAYKKANNDKIVVNATKAEIYNEPYTETMYDYNLVGSFVEQTVPGNAYIIGNDCFWLSSELTAADKGGATAVKTKGFRAYILPKGSNAAGSRLMIGFSDNVTAVDALNKAEEGITECYDVMGRRLSAPQKGINIIKIGNKTKKVIIK